MYVSVKLINVHYVQLISDCITSVTLNALPTEYTQMAEIHKNGIHYH
jgi:hypothetical protein